LFRPKPNSEKHREKQKWPHHLTPFYKGPKRCVFDRWKLVLGGAPFLEKWILDVEVDWTGILGPVVCLSEVQKATLVFGWDSATFSDVL
jgi:hypothetical protein